MSDPAKYRTREEVNKIKADRDPIENLKAYLMSDKMFNETDLKELDASIKKEMLEAADFAINSNLPSENELWTDVYI